MAAKYRPHIGRPAAAIFPGDRGRTSPTAGTGNPTREPGSDMDMGNG
jgi:hypothetical protein